MADSDQVGADLPAELFQGVIAEAAGAGLDRFSTAFLFGGHVDDGDPAVDLQPPAVVLDQALLLFALTGAQPMIHVDGAEPAASRRLGQQMKQTDRIGPAGDGDEDMVAVLNQAVAPQSVLEPTGQ
ncbi:hypothetical protein DPPLL_12100 [Desulfofustis limnaeus]|uniref:Uncharacterized protein n=1 Tax=Desulfofustis limnaeus TaxID=2740163 RepID=A0ABM7W798_9BACT|nr:hypothetical protein DPPLL_12100 [Desulfofustis limnaeus]